MTREPSRRRRRVLAIAVLAVALAIAAPELVSPAGAAYSGGNATQRVTGTHVRAHAFAKKPKKAKQPKKAKKANKAKAGSTGFHLTKRDDLEIALLALLPVVVMGLWLLGSGYRRFKEVSPDR